MLTRSGWTSPTVDQFNMFLYQGWNGYLHILFRSDGSTSTHEHMTDRFYTWLLGLVCFIHVFKFCRFNICLVHSYFHVLFLSYFYLILGLLLETHFCPLGEFQIRLFITALMGLWEIFTQITWKRTGMNNTIYIWWKRTDAIDHIPNDWWFKFNVQVLL